MVAGSFAGASGARSGASAKASAAPSGYPQAEYGQPQSVIKFLAQDQNSVDMLSSLGIDVTEGTTKNPDGTTWISAVVTPEQTAYLKKIGYQEGQVVETPADAVNALNSMVSTARATNLAKKEAVTGKRSIHALATPDVVKVTRADYFQSYSGTWLSVEAKTSGAQGNAAVPAGTPGCPTSGSSRCSVNGGSTTGSCWGNPAGGAAALTTAACPTLVVTISTDGSTYFTPSPASTTTMGAYIDDGVYQYHRILIRLSNFAGNATAPVPVSVRVASNDGGISTRTVTPFTDTPPPPQPNQDFLTRYMTPEDDIGFIMQLHAQFPDITQLIPLPYKTEGFRRHAQASVGCAVASTSTGNSMLPGSPGARPAGFATPSSCSVSNPPKVTDTGERAVVLTSKQWGNDNGVDEGNLITTQLLNPGVPSSPLSVSVSGNAITVSLATDATGALSSTTNQVVAAINADPNASALVTAETYRNATLASTAIPQATGVIPLSDFLFAPQPGSAAALQGGTYGGFVPGGSFGVARAPFQNYVLRICKVCDGSKPGFWMYSEEHAREWVAPLVSLEAAARLLNNYGDTDGPGIASTADVDNLDIFVMPVENPDGSNYSMLNGSTSFMQRKDMVNYCGSSSDDPANHDNWGVDINRNFSVGSFFDGYEGGSTIGTAAQGNGSDCTSETYSGPSELSETPPQNEVWLNNTYPNIKFSMNIHTYGGYFMWSPASYKTVGRVALPYASYGQDRYIWAVARKVITAIKGYRNTVITPARTGPVVDVLYSAAGNSSDEFWYNHNTIAYDFECGAQTYSTTSTTSATGSDVGFQPNFASEGHAEGMEFANGMYGLMSTAVDYANDTTAPTVTPSVPSGTISQTPIALTLNESEPADIYYTTDGSTPSTSSTLYQYSGFREQEGQTLTFTHNTTLKFFGVDERGNTESVQTATFVVDSTPPVTTAGFSPPAVGGWYSHPTVTLSATDDNSGVASTSYTLDSGASTAYTAPLSGFSNGTHTLTYSSTDNAGNVEALHSVTFQVDSTAPTTTSSLSPASPTGSNGWYLGPVQVTLTASDTGGSGVASTAYSIDGGSNQAYSAPFTISADGAHTVTFFSTDAAGNAEAANSITVKVDQNDPVTTATLSPAISNGWYAGPTVTLSATDGTGSGVARIDYSLDGGPWGQYTMPLHVTSSGNHMIQYRATDNAGRVEATKVTAFAVDAVPPTVTISNPGDGNSYPLDKVVKASYKCSDALSGLASCVGTVANGAAIDTSTPGTHAFSVTATDNAGNTKTVTIHYQVTYTWNGFFAPISNTGDGLNLVHAGDLIKIGFGLNGDRGLNVFAAGFPTSVPIACPSSAPHTVPAGGAGTMPGLTYGAASGHYTFGWQTNAGWAGTCRQFQVQLNDGTPFLHTADFMFFS